MHLLSIGIFTKLLGGPFPSMPSKSLLLPHLQQCCGRFIHSNHKLVNSSCSNDNFDTTSSCLFGQESNLHPLPTTVLCVTTQLEKGHQQIESLKVTVPSIKSFNYFARTQHFEKSSVKMGRPNIKLIDSE